LIGGLLPVQANLGIALAVGNAGHAQIHADLGALAVEVGHQLLEDVLLVLLADVGVILHSLGIDTVLVLSSQLHLALHLIELGTGGLADRAELRGILPFVDITADRANPLLHSYFLLFNKFYFTN